MSEWKEYRLGDILSIKSGFSYKGKYIGTGKSLLLGMGCVSFREKFLLSGARPYSGPYDERYKVYPGDIVLATRQQSDNLPILAMPAMVPYSLDGKDIVIGTNLYKVEITDKSFPNDYIYWLLKTKRYINYIAGVKTGTTVSMVTKKNVEDFTFIAPINPEERIEIASVMASLDDKIAVNRRICENLEAQAQALFKHWFIDFAPFKDGKFVESELGMIPEGWRVGSPYEYLDFVYGAPYKSNLFNADKEGLPLIRIRDLKDCSPQFYTPEVLPKSECVNAGDILAGMDAEFAPYIWKGQQGLLNQRVCKIKPKNKEIGRLFCMLLVKPQLLFTQAVKTGTTVSHIGKSDIDRFKVILPPSSEVVKYSKLGEKILDEIVTVSAESSRLSTLRDTLLPKLMSGQIKL